MNTPITITPEQFINFILLICGAMITISGATSVVINLIKKSKDPEIKQNKRIDAIEQRLDKIDRMLYVDKQRLDRIEYGSTVTQEALLALLDHALNKDDVAPIKEAKKKLERYLLDKDKPYDYDVNKPYNSYGFKQVDNKGQL